MPKAMRRYPSCGSGDVQKSVFIDPLDIFLVVTDGGCKYFDAFCGIFFFIGILMKDYSKGTGDKAVTVTTNISPEEAKFILSRLNAGFQEYTFQQEKIFGSKDATAYKCRRSHFSGGFPSRSPLQ